MILIKGRKVAFEMTSGKTIRARPNYAIIHDPEGQSLPYCNVLIGPYQKTKTPVELTSEAKKYFGSGYPGTAAFVDFPRGPWKSLGAVRTIYYERTHGSQNEGRYFHPFDEKQTVTLSRCGSFYRLELPKGCVVNWRGFVYP